VFGDSTSKESLIRNQWGGKVRFYKGYTIEYDCLVYRYRSAITGPAVPVTPSRTLTKKEKKGLKKQPRHEIHQTIIKIALRRYAAHKEEKKRIKTQWKQRARDSAHGAAHPPTCSTMTSIVSLSSISSDAGVSSSLILFPSYKNRMLDTSLPTFAA